MHPVMESVELLSRVFHGLCSLLRGDLMRGDSRLAAFAEVICATAFRGDDSFHSCVHASTSSSEPRRLY